MSTIALKIDVDTYRGTREGVPRLAGLLERLDLKATFLFSVGPDHTGRAIKRVFRRGFLGKVRRTSVASHYGLRTLLYGVLLPGPHIGRRCRDVMRGIARRGFEVGLHTYDHIKWQDGVARASAAWTAKQLRLACEAYTDALGEAPMVHGAAGWQMNDFVPELQRACNFRYASDTRGTRPFLPRVHGRVVPVPQLPTTLPTFDELIGRPGVAGGDPARHLLALTAASAGQDQVFTLHAELEGGAYLQDFERLLRAWRDQGARITDLAGYVAQLDTAALPSCAILPGQVAGRSGTLAVQGPAAPRL